MNSHSKELADAASINVFPSDGTILVSSTADYVRVAISSIFAAHGYQVVQHDPDKDPRPLTDTLTGIDLCVLDLEDPQSSVHAISECQRIKTEKRWIPVVLLLSPHNREYRLKGYAAGADDWFTRPPDGKELSIRALSLIRQKRLNEELDNAGSALFAIAGVVEARDPNTGNHCARLALLAEEFGNYLMLDRDQIKNLRWGSYLHDLGKVGISDSILLKPGKLTPEEFEAMKAHVLIGESICMPLQTMRGVLPIIRNHHERWDGTGYPDKLMGNAIPLLAQIFQLIDIYDALTSERPYKSAFPPEQAIAMMREEADRGWRSPELIDKFSDFIEEKICQSTANDTPMTGKKSRSL
ncbi:MAG TPA: HD domain-containing phosphohydrolase [Trichocoleus sp.]